MARSMDTLLSHFQTSFSIGGFEGSPGPVYVQAQDILRRWIAAKENARARRFNNKAYGLVPDVRFGTRSEGKSWRSSYRTESGDIENGAAWALEYTHLDDEIDGLSWRNDATLHIVDDGRRIAVSLSIARQLSPELFQRAEATRMPAPATPQCARRLFSEIPGTRLLSGDVDVTPPAGRHLRLVTTPDEAARAAEDIRSPSRGLPFVLLVGASTDPSNFAEALAHDLVGKAVVCNVPNQPALLEPFRPFKAAFGQCRVLLPFRRFGARLRAHPLRSFATAAEAAALRPALGALLLADFRADEPGAVPDLPTLSALLGRARLARLRAELFRSDAAPADPARWESFARELLLENARLGKHRAELEHALRHLQDRLFILERRDPTDRP